MQLHGELVDVFSAEQEAVLLQPFALHVTTHGKDSRQHAEK